MKDSTLIDYKRLSISVHNARFINIDGKTEKMSLRDLAEKVRISYNTLARVEQGNICDLETYAKICMFLNVSMDEFKVKQ